MSKKRKNTRQARLQASQDSGGCSKYVSSIALIISLNALFKQVITCQMYRTHTVVDRHVIQQLQHVEESLQTEQT